MPVFICSKCKCIENTATCRYWVRGNEPPLCSECDPKIDKWHGIFKKRKATEADRNRVLNPEEIK